MPTLLCAKTAPSHTLLRLPCWAFPKFHPLNLCFGWFGRYTLSCCLLRGEIPLYLHLLNGQSVVFKAACDSFPTREKKKQLQSSTVLVFLVLGSVAVAVWNYAQTLVWSDRSTFSSVFRWAYMSASVVVIFLSSSFPACTSQVEKVCSSSDEENLQPFKGKMDAFLTQGKHLKNTFQLFSEQLHW